MPRDPKPSDNPKPGQPPDAAVGFKPVCPNCGQRPAIVFPALADAKPLGKPKLVCLLCCPKRTDHS
jgi:hypothetical protein